MQGGRFGRSIALGRRAMRFGWSGARGGFGRRVARCLRFILVRVGPMKGILFRDGMDFRKGRGGVLEGTLVCFGYYIVA